MSNNKLNREAKIDATIRQYGSITNFLEVYRTIMAPSSAATNVEAIMDEQKRKSMRMWGVHITPSDIDLRSKRRAGVDGHVKPRSHRF